MHPIRSCQWLLFAVIFLLGSGARLSAMSLAGRQDRRQFAAAIKEAFLKEDYAALEATVGELRASKDHFPEGIWTLSVFYNALQLENLPLHALQEFEARLGRWQAAYPGSVTVGIVRSQALRDFSWGRVEGQAETNVTARLARARAELEAVAGGVPAPGPDWWAERLRVAWRQKVPQEEFDALYARAVAVEPGYQLFYFVKADDLRVRGGAAAWTAFALEAGQKNLSGEGMGLYSRLVWSQSQLYADGVIFQHRGVEWARMREGFRDLERAWPNSPWNLNNFCRFACLAGDRATARELFARLGDQWTTNWLSHAAFKNWQSWAQADVDPIAVPGVRLAEPTTGKIWGGGSIAFSADGASVFGGYEVGHVVRWDAATGALRWRGELGPGKVRGLAVSPDGRTLAGGTTSTGGKGSVGTVGLWDLPPSGEPASVLPARWLGTNHRGGVQAVRWASDGRSLAAVGGGSGDSFGELSLWAMPGGAEVRHLTDWPLAINAAVFLDPDGRRLARASGQSFHVEIAATGEKVFYPRGKMHESSVRALALSPDGKTLACATAAPFMERDQPAEVAFWDTVTWTRRPVPSITNAGGVMALAWSSDGRWLLGGGSDGFLRAWDAATGKTVRSWPPEPGAGQITAVAWSPDGRRAAAVRSHDVGLVYAFETPPPAAR